MKRVHIVTISGPLELLPYVLICPVKKGTVSYDWRQVTCKNCLKHKPKRKIEIFKRRVL